MDDGLGYRWMNKLMVGLVDDQQINGWLDDGQIHGWMMGWWMDG